MSFRDISDPTDLKRIKQVIAAAAEPERLVSLEIKHMEISWSASEQLLPIAAALLTDAGIEPVGANVLLMTDDVEILKGQINFKNSTFEKLSKYFKVTWLKLEADGVRLASTITASITTKKHEILQRVEALAALAGGGVTVEMFGLDAPEFPYRPDSQLLATASRVYREVMGSEPSVEVSQCSLELGMFSRRVPVEDIISIGTELHALHSPAEKVNHTSVAKVWPLVKAVVAQLG